MYIPYLYSIIVIWAFMFNPQWIDAIPLGALWIKQLAVMITLVIVWAMLSLAAIANER